MNDTLPITTQSPARRWFSASWPYLLVLGFLILFPLLAGATISDPAVAEGAGGLSGLMARAESGAAKFWQGMIIQILIFAIFAMSYDLLLGYTGILSFGHAMFFGTGGYAIAIFIGRNFNWSFGMALLAVIIIALVQSLVFGVLSLRVKGVYLAMVTL